HREEPVFSYIRVLGFSSILFQHSSTGFRQKEMGRAKKGPKFAVMKKLASHKAIKQHKEEVLNPNKKDLTKEKLPRNVPYVSSALFFTYNTALGPPYRVLVDTNFINFSIQNKLDLEKGMMDCLYAKCTPCITDCVMAELEKLGQKYRVALSSKNMTFGRSCMLSMIEFYVTRRTDLVEIAHYCHPERLLFFKNVLSFYLFM
ncbi:Protein of unknown function DUF652, partial [Cynara cardunculus var. scolymus]